MPIEDFLTPDEQRNVVAAIAAAERRTSGEIRVHVEPRCQRNPLTRATQVFGALQMHLTAERNGVLIYVAFESRKFAIVGDEGINKRVGASFWEDAKHILAHAFALAKPGEGLCNAIALIGTQLSNYFPPKENDVNELSDEISYSE